MESKPSSLFLFLPVLFMAGIFFDRSNLDVRILSSKGETVGQLGLIDGEYARKKLIGMMPDEELSILSPLQQRAAKRILQKWQSYRDRRIFVYLKHAVCRAEESLTHQVRVHCL
jgi:hypothetical protein